MPQKSQRSIFVRLANRLGDGVRRMTASFTPAIGARQPTPTRVTSAAIQAAGALLPAQLEKRITPEQTFDTSLHPSPEPTAATVIKEDVPAQEPQKQEPTVSASRVQQYLLARFNPIRGLTPHLLSTYLEQSDLGFLRQAQLVWNKIRERDDQIQAVAVNRELRPTDMEWEIVMVDESPEAMQHKEALEDFYNHCTVTHCLDGNTRGGVQLLIRQMMRAVGDKFSVHEIVWQPQPDLLTAEFRYVPLWFFENRTGQLRFLPYELALQGVPLDPAGWCVHVAEGLFQATSVAYLFKQLALKNWVTYTEKFGFPFLHGKTNAQFGSDEWTQFKQALEQFTSDGSILTSLQAELAAVPITGGSGEMPHPILVDRMDRAIARIWKGGDLSTMSRGSGTSKGGGGGAAVGAMPQMQNEDDLAKADAVRISETLQFYVDAWVLRYKFGTNQPLAKFMLQPKRDVDAQREIAVDTFLMQCGVPTSIHDLTERYGRSMPDEDEELATPPPPKAPAFGGGSGSIDGLGIGNVAASSFARYQTSSVRIVAEATARAMQPVKERLAALLAIDDAALRRAGALKLREDLPRLLKGTATNAALIETLQNAIGTAIVIGETDGAQRNGNGRNGRNRLAEHFLK